MKVLFLILTIFIVAAFCKKNCRPNEEIPNSSDPVIVNEACPVPTIQATFDVQKAKGMWYGVKSYPSVFFSGNECVTVDWFGITGSDPYSHNKSVCEIYNGEEICTTFLVNHPHQDGQITFDVLEPYVRYEGYFIEMNYVDYYIFVVCSNLGDGRSQRTVFIVSRTPVLSQPLLRQAYKKVAAAGFDTSRFVDVNQDEELCGWNKK